MEIRSFAEQVLFATTLDEKLAPPSGEITDERPGTAILAPTVPGRPATLRFKRAGHRDGHDFPGLRRLEQERERGRLLHFFANHELLATELMALVLLRFPDAPAAFRRGVLRTLQDEQEHTRLYLARMRACGVTFGEQPVSGYFWRCVAVMENPLDYVAGLSLTFEQANLDFARHFAQGFATVGDAETARLLDRIYRDEIGHVAYGLKWFRRWKNPGESDWEAFCRQLKFPLSPQRAKGVTLNVAGRRAAGLDPAFIAELEVYARSRGRTPDVYLFNPFAESYIARGPGFTPSTAQRQHAADLAHLPMFLARKDDIVLVPQRPRVAFLRDLQDAGFALPEFADDAAALVDRKLGRLRPWAWSSDSVAALAPLLGSLSGRAPAPEHCFNPTVAALFTKTWSAAFLRGFLGRHAQAWLCSVDDVAVSVRTPDTAWAAIAAIRGRGHHRVIVKEALGLAGQNAIRLWEPDLQPAQREWIERRCRSGAALVVEPWLERVIDFSMQAEMTMRGLELVGFTGLTNDGAGRFLGNSAAPDRVHRVPAAVAACFPNVRDIAPRLRELYEDMRRELGVELGRVGFSGPVGVDAFVYRAADDTCRLKPVVEINPRFTMGRLTLELMRHVAPGCFGRLRILNRAALKAAGCPGFVEFAQRTAKQHPLERAGEPVARIRNGAVFLNDPATAQTCLAIFEVGRSPTSIDS